MPAPAWSTTRWFNTREPLDLDVLRGRVVVVYAFQLLCPGCVHTSLPQARRVHEAFDGPDLAVVGLHTVFEHHAAMGPEVLEAFLHENRIRFPVGVDAPGTGPTPMTMERYALRGTPSLLLFDRAGALREQHFGEVDDLRLGAKLAALVAEECAATGTCSRPVAS